MPKPDDPIKEVLREVLFTEPLGEGMLDGLTKAFTDGMADREARYQEKLSANAELTSAFIKNISLAKGIKETLKIIDAGGVRINDEIIDNLKKRHQHYLSEAESYLALYRIANGI